MESQTIPNTREPKTRQSRPLAFQGAYVWLVFVAALDIMFTWIVLYKQGVELNPVANSMIRVFGAKALVAYKFVLISFVIILCEIAHRKNRHKAAVVLISFAILMTCVPVIVAMLQLIDAKHPFLP